MAEEEVTGKQIGCMFALGKRLGMNGDDIHALAEKITGKESLRAMSRSQAGLVIDHMRVMCGEEPNAARWGKPSPRELGMIRAIAKQMGWSDDRLRAFIEKRFHISHLRFLDDRTARKVIEALKAMQKGGRGERRKTPDDRDTTVVT